MDRYDLLNFFSGHNLPTRVFQSLPGARIVIDQASTRSNDMFLFKLRRTLLVT
jgi:hypothetical protein